VAGDLSGGVTEIFSTSRAFAALKADGSVVTWGSGSSGGDSSAVARDLSGGVTEIFSTATAFAALKEDGSVVTWGSGTAGGDSISVADQLTSGVVGLASPFADQQMPNIVGDDDDGTTSPDDGGSPPATDDPYVPDSLDLEYAARVVAYQRNGADGDYTLPDGYTLEDPIVTDSGFFAVPIVSDNGEPILAVRGTVNAADLFTNADPRGVGVGQFEDAMPSLGLWLSNNPNTHVTGHSLGGAQAQLIAAEVSAGNLEAASSVASVTTFNAPGISQNFAERFNTADVSEVRHFVAAGDVVSKAGEAFLPGDVTLYHFDSLIGANFENPYETINTQILTAHTGHWSQPDMDMRGYDDYTLPQGYDIYPDNFTVDQLNDDNFSYLSINDNIRGISYRDGDYDLIVSLMSPSFLDKASNFFLSQLGVGFVSEISLDLDPPLESISINEIGLVMKERQSVEALRVAAGERAVVGEFIGDFLSGAFSNPLSVVAPGGSLVKFLASNLFSSRDTNDVENERPLEIGSNVHVSLATGLPQSTYVSGPGPTQVTMSEGFNTVFGTTEDLNGDAISGFGRTDQILISGNFATTDGVSITPGSAIISVDKNGDGVNDSTLTLLGEYNIGAFDVEIVPDGLAITVDQVDEDLGDDASTALLGKVKDSAGNMLSGVTIQLNGESTTTDAAGAFAFEIASGMDGRLDAVRDYGAGDPAVTASDALDVLRLAVGLDASWGPPQAQNFIAADVNQDGQVTASDALDVLRHAVGLETENAPSWVFIDADDNDQLQNITRGSVSYETGIDLGGLDLETSEISLTGILRGNMDEYAV
jgi:hypothetical protein